MESIQIEKENSKIVTGAAIIVLHKCGLIHSLDKNGEKE